MFGFGQQVERCLKAQALPPFDLPNLCSSDGVVSIALVSEIAQGAPEADWSHEGVSGTAVSGIFQPSSGCRASRTLLKREKE